METADQEAVQLIQTLEEQVRQVTKAIKNEPSKERQILMVFLSHFFDAIKETIRRQGDVMPLTITLADPAEFGMPPLTEDDLSRAKELKAAAVVLVEGFQSQDDIGDIVYHVSMSAFCLGVVGWVLKVRLSDGRAEFVREMPYIFDSTEKVKTLGELIEEMESG
jgi:hypothetical protein